ncbi:MAG: SDR family oxidoreductase [Chitinophagaceae bacterium]|nr:SDR family oxidoreductase [Chitinophagaceae bacterium]
MSKTVLIPGASGRTGRELVRQSLQRGWSVHVLVRKPAHFPFENNNQLSIFEGSADDAELLSRAMSGCEAIISALNISRNNDFPWSSLRTPVNFLSETMKKLVVLAPEYGIQRLLFTSAWGVGDSRKRYSPLVQVDD